MWEFLKTESMDVAVGLTAWFVAWCIPFRRVDARPDFRWDAIGLAAVVVFVAVALLPLQTLFDRATAWGGLQRWYEFVDRWPAWAIVTGYLLLADFGSYWAHRALHSRWLWSAHAWHHASHYLYWASGLRGAPLHIFMLLVPGFAALAVFPTPEAALSAIAVVWLEIANQHYIHSNIRFPHAGALEWIFVTPRFHFVHHSRKPAVSNSNYGFIFSFWDRMFGTYTDPETIPADDPLGLDYENSNWRLLIGLSPPKKPRQAAVDTPVR